jgi:HEAT repeat protein
LAEGLDEAGPEEQGRFAALAVGLGKPAVNLVFEVMSHATHVRTRAAACTALGYQCAEEPELLGPYLNDPRWDVVLNIVFVLGQIGGPKVVDLLGVAAHHPEPKVRRQVVQALGSVPATDRLPVLLNELDTLDPQLLAATLNMLTREKNRDVARAILDCIESPGFESRTEDSQRTLFHALADVADDEAISALEALLNKGGWFSRRTFTRLAAARTLQRIGTLGAIAVLQAGLKSKSAAVRGACQEALKSGGSS